MTRDCETEWRSAFSKDMDRRVERGAARRLGRRQMLALMAAQAAAAAQQQESIGVAAVVANHDKGVKSALFTQNMDQSSSG